MKQPNENTQTKSMFFNLFRLLEFILTCISSTMSATLQSLTAGGKGASLQFLSTLCGSGPGLVFAERERPTRRGQSSCRRAPQPKGQLSTASGGENNGASARAVLKKDESGSLSISTACRHCSEPQGLRGGGGRQPWA